MSRRYRIEINIDNDNKVELDEMFNIYDTLECDYGISIDSDNKYDYFYSFAGEISLCGGESEEQAHARICEIKDKFPDILTISTNWLYLERNDESFTTKIRR